MCLDTLWTPKRLAKLQARAKRGPVKAWKVVLVQNDKRYPAYYNWWKPFKELNVCKTRGRIYTLRARHALNGVGDLKYNGESYLEGFHAYASKASARSEFLGNPYQLWPCLLRDIVAAGTQYGHTVYVARKLRFVD